MNSSREIAEDLRGHIREIETELSVCRRALDVLDPPAAPAPSAPRRRRSRPKAIAHTNGTVSTEAVLDALRAGNGNQAPALASMLGTSSTIVLKRLHELQEDGVVLREGERSKTRWQVA